VQARNRDLTALGEVGRAVSSTLDLKVVLKTIVDRAVDLSGTDACSIFYYRQEVGRFELGETSGLSQDVVVGLRKLNILARETGLGEAIARRQPLQLPDVTKRASNPLRDAALDAGLRAALIVLNSLYTMALKSSKGHFEQALALDNLEQARATSQLTGSDYGVAILSFFRQDACHTRIPRSGQITHRGTTLGTRKGTWPYSIAGLLLRRHLLQRLAASRQDDVDHRGRKIVSYCARGKV
jgi:GAF domain-containing protein